MARTAISRTVVAADGLNLTDATFTTLSTGDGNGVEFDHYGNDIIVLKNDTGGAAVFTLHVKTPREFSEQSIIVPDVTESVATAKTHLYPNRAIFKQADGKVWVDCDVAGKVIVLAR